MASSLDDVTRADVPHVVDFTVVQLNDVYEAAPVESGRVGGLARVATLLERLKKENPNLLSVLVGDFLSPSAIGSTTGDSGQHMIEAFNAMGLTHATIGNHEFDVPESDLLLRIAESDFTWVSSNVSDGQGQPFANVARNDVVEFANKAGDKVRVALVGFCIDMVKKSWIQYQDSVESARAQVAELDGKADVFLAMTHLSITEDKELGAQVPRLDVLMGGHEHEAARAIVGDDATPIFKADSNARSVCIHRFRYDAQSGVSKLFTELVPIDSSIPDEPTTAAAIKKWEDITFDTLRAQGTDPLEVIGKTDVPLNGAERDIRRGPTSLTDLIIKSFFEEVPDVDAVIFPVSVVRIDAILAPGDIIFFDVVRVFPINCKLSIVEAPGSLIRMLLDMGEQARGTGSYSIRGNITQGEGGWQIKGETLDDEQSYKIAFGEIPAAFFSYPPFKGSGARKLYDTRDVRAIFADSLRRGLS